MMTHELILHLRGCDVLSPEAKRNTLIRLTALSFILSGILGTLFPILRPPFGLLAYSCGMAAFILLSLGFFGVYAMLQNTRAERYALWALVLGWFGVGLTLPVFGVEMFSNAIGPAAMDENHSALLHLSSVYLGLGFTFLVTGLTLIGVAAIVLDVAIRKTDNLPQLSGILIALGFAVYLPLFESNPSLQAARIADALLILAGCVWLGWGMWTHTRITSEKFTSSGTKTLKMTTGISRGGAQEAVNPARAEPVVSSSWDLELEHRSGRSD